MLASLRPNPTPNPVSPENEPPNKKLPVFLFSLIETTKSTFSSLNFFQY